MPTPMASDSTITWAGDSKRFRMSSMYSVLRMTFWPQSTRTTAKEMRRAILSDAAASL